MRLAPEAEKLLGSARIGMLALHGRRHPLVNPAAFNYSAGSVWMTTSRHAVKTALARHDPRAAFLVDAGGWGLMLQGLLDVYDLRTASGALRAAMDGWRFSWGLGNYVLKNAAFIGGYVLDLRQVPRDWLPQNRVVLRLRPERARPVSGLAAPPAAAARLPGLSADMARRLARVSNARLCWYAGGWPVLAPALWAAGETDVAAWLPPGSPRAPADDVPAALVVEAHHRYRATRMLGSCLRGRLRSSDGAATAVGARYGIELEGGGTSLRLQPAQVTRWRGFNVETKALEVPAGARPAAE